MRKLKQTLKKENNIVSLNLNLVKFKLFKLLFYINEMILEKNSNLKIIDF